MLRNRRASLKEVAALAGTSVATASRVLSGKGYASPEAKERVLQAAKQLSYHPNLRARGLRQQSNSGIGLIIPNLLNAYYTALADTASQLLARLGYHLLLSSTRDDPLLEQAIMRDMIGQDVAGLIWVPSSCDRKLVDCLLRQQIPAVSIVRRVPGDVLDTVVFADYDGSYAATQHLIQLGHRAIGYIGGDVRYSSNRARWQGYLAAMRDAHLPVDERLVKLGTALSAWGEAATSELLRLPSLPTALFVASNAIMPGVIKVLRRHEVAIPEEISLLCFDDVDWFSFSVPPITAVQISHAKLAETALDLLMKRIEDPERPLSFVEIDFKLVVRSSTGPPRHRPESDSENVVARPMMGWRSAVGA